MSKELKISKKVDAKKWVEENGYPEVGTFTEKKWLQKFYKQLDTDTIQDWLTLEGLTFKPCPDNAPIERMRMCMAILYMHFPKVPSTAKPKKESKYAKYSTEDLIQMAIDNDLTIETCDDMRIMRMRCIMVLRAMGKLA